MSPTVNTPRNNPEDRIKAVNMCLDSSVGTPTLIYADLQQVPYVQLAAAARTFAKSSPVHRRVQGLDRCAYITNPVLERRHFVVQTNGQVPHNIRRVGVKRKLVISFLRLILRALGHFTYLCEIQGQYQQAKEEE
ncbi:hypothetical protein B0H17DRAFT_1131036 [Mycena rosella]|uniref:Uncharacterized protein n=1 Tax=Mycena rosella TaxID=1033263 RepID=A0AAD7GNL3_MYCRO|nr:hypothetical protein B0H17DRAFT_1131036 [Mycena rosella]